MAWCDCLETKKFHNSCQRKSDLFWHSKGPPLCHEEMYSCGAWKGGGHQLTSDLCCLSRSVMTWDWAAGSFQKTLSLFSLRPAAVRELPSISGFVFDICREIGWCEAWPQRCTQCQPMTLYEIKFKAVHLLADILFHCIRSNSELHETCIICTTMNWKGFHKFGGEVNAKISEINWLRTRRLFPLMLSRFSPCTNACHKMLAYACLTT